MERFSYMVRPMDEPKQLSLDVNTYDSLIDQRAQEALDEIRRMTEDAQEFINRSCGQRRRRLRELFNRGDLE